LAQSKTSIKKSRAAKPGSPLFYLAKLPFVGHYAEGFKFSYFTCKTMINVCALANLINVILQIFVAETEVVAFSHDGRIPSQDVC
jgi:hypothetical protein